MFFLIILSSISKVNFPREEKAQKGINFFSTQLALSIVGDDQFDENNLVSHFLFFFENRIIVN